MKNLFIGSLAIITSLFVGSIFAADDEPTPNWKEETLTGDWGGMRTNLYKQGLDMQFTHKSDVLSNTSGGIKHGVVWMEDTDVKLGLDLEKLLGWHATTALIHYHSDLGSKFNTNYVGGFMGEDNIEVATNTAQFDQAWLQKSWLEGRLSVLAGLYAMDTEFYVTDSSGVFLQPPYGMANELAQTGVNGPPVFPVGALAVRAKYTLPSNNFYVQGAVMDGVPGDPNNPHGTHIKLGHGDGTLSIIEFGYTPTHEAETPEQGAVQEVTLAINKAAIGIWRYSARFDDLVDVDALGNPIRHHSQGAYVIAEHTLLVEKEHPSQGLTIFGRFGVASESIHQADWTGSLGLNYLGLINGRDNDIAGVAITLNHASDKYRLANNSTNAEFDVELTYRAQIKPWLAVQPTLQYISNPNMDKAIKDATVIGFRTEIAF